MTIDVVLAIVASLLALAYLPGAIREWRDTPSARDQRSIERRNRTRDALR